MKPRFPKDPWRLLLLLGFLCQGFACNSWVVFPGIYAACWYASWKYQQPCRRVSEEIELLILLGALSITWMLRFQMNVIWFAAIGNGLVVFQILRSYFPPPSRQKMMTAAVAVTQIAIGAQAVFDYRFVFILAAAVVLIPRCLHQLESERLVVDDAQPVLFPRKRDFAYVAVLMVGFFLLFPRVPVSSARSGLGLPSGPQRPDLDMSDGGTDGTDSLVFRIEGENIEYIRTFALDHFDGVLWTASPVMERRVRAPNLQVESGDLKRTVRVHSFGVTRNFLPSEANTIRIAGSLPYRVYVAEHGGMMMDRNLRATVDYDFWVRRDREEKPLSEQDRRRYLDAPEVSPEIVAWMHTVVADETEPAVIANLLMENFRAADYTYQIGAPVLNEETALEDFLLREKTGHCGRYASALAALLRAKAIPSRIVVGFLARERNDFGGFYTVRARHAHAWTEAWIDGGWKRLDATPDGGGFEMERIAVTQTAGEWLEYVWYNRIVNFGFREQESLLSGLNIGVQGAARLLFGGWPYALGIVLFLALIRVGIYFRALIRARRLGQLNPAEQRRRAIEEAGHFYGQMVRALARFQLVRGAAQTPVEFLKDAESAELSVIQEVRMITNSFCRVRYAEAPVTDELRQQMAAALSRIKKG